MANKGELRDGKDYDTFFNPEDFLNTYYKQTDGHIYVQFVLDSLHNLFSKGNIKGKRLLDIGCGPCIHTVIPAAKWFDEIILSDFAKPNRDMQTKWMTCQKDARDWTSFFKYYSKLDGKEDCCRCKETRDEWPSLEKEVRQKIKNIVPCNVHLNNPLHTESVCMVDAITTSLCLESASTDVNSYKQAMKNVASLLKPAGKLILIGILNNPFYTVGLHKFSCLSINKDDVVCAIELAGLNVLSLFYDTSHAEGEYNPYNGCLVILAEKKQ